MVDVIQIAQGTLEPADDRAVYVWADVAQPVWGSIGAFRQRPQFSARFSDADWRTAIEHATDEAAETGLATVYVVRHA
jgi:hypothetical protein